MFSPKTTTRCLIGVRVGAAAATPPPPRHSATVVATVVRRRPLMPPSLGTGWYAARTVAPSRRARYPPRWRPAATPAISVGREVRVPVAQAAEARPELPLGRLVVERAVDVGRVERVDAGRELLDLSRERLELGGQRQLEVVER